MVKAFGRQAIVIQNVFAILARKSHHEPADTAVERQIVRSDTLDRHKDLDDTRFSIIVTVPSRIALKNRMP